MKTSLSDESFASFKEILQEETVKEKMNSLDANLLEQFDHVFKPEADQLEALET